MNVSSLNKETLNDVYEIQATLENGALPVIACNYTPDLMANPSVVGRTKIAIQIEREDGTPFTNANEARAELYKQPLRGVLADLNFNPRPSNKADIFHKALIKFMDNRVDPINREQVSQVAQLAQLDATELNNVLAELDGRQIDCHANGTISLQPEGF